jgi:class 3 adenylate cyclase
VSFPFWIKLTFGAALLAVVPAALVSFRALAVITPGLEEDRRALQLAASQHIADLLDGDLAGARADLDGVARAFTDPAVSQDGRLATVLALVGASDALDHVAIYDDDGALIDRIVEAGVALAPASPRLADALRPGAAAGSVLFGPAEAWEGEVRVPVVVPIVASGRRTGFASSLASLAPIQRRLERLAAERFAGIGDALFVVDRELRIVVHPDAEVAHRLTPIGDRGVLGGMRAAVEHGVASYGEMPGPAGRMVGSLTPLPGRPFSVVAQVPVARAYAPIVALRRLTGLALAIAAAASIVLAFVFARTVTRPIRRLVAFAGELAARRFDRRVTVTTRDELALLGAAMSGAAAELEVSEGRIRAEQAIRADLGRYLPRQLVDKVVAREQDMQLGGARRSVTVLFADVVAFTQLAERLPAETTVAMLNELFTILTEIVFRHDGVVDKLMGDCLMAMWGAPTDQPDHARRALRAAEDMQRWTEAARASWRDRWGADVQLAIGVSSGEAVVGNVGSERRMEYTAIGDTVNVAARLETIARPGQILATRATRELAAAPPAPAAGFDFVESGRRELTGRSGMVDLYEVRW